MKFLRFCFFSGNLKLSVVLGIGNEDELIPDLARKFDEIIIKHDWQINIELLIITKI